MSNKYRLVTRSDMDGLVCAVILKQLNMIDEITFVHPKDMQDGKIEITSNDIITNLPYSPNAYIVFDHHESEAMRNGDADNYHIDPNAPSAARIVYEYYGGAKKLPAISEDMMIAVDKADAAQFSKDDILNPKGWELLSFLMDSRTGLGRFREFTVSNYQLMMDLIDYCIDHERKIIMSCNIARRAKKQFRSSIKSKGAYHFDKTDPNHLKLPLNIDNISDDTMHNIISKMVEKYQSLNYKSFDREELNEHKEWDDLQLILLIKFYKNGWSIQIDEEKEFFPNFIFTYNPKPLKEKIDLIVSYCYDHINEDDTKKELENNFSWSALEVTYLLHYFVIIHPDYIE